eukprot:4647118-Prymnesium_polylepis.1
MPHECNLSLLAARRAKRHVPLPHVGVGGPLHSAAALQGAAAHLHGVHALRLRDVRRRRARDVARR